MNRATASDEMVAVLAMSSGWQSAGARVGDRTTDDSGRFSVDVGIFSGLLVVTASGGSFTDQASGKTVALDTTDELRSLARLELAEERDDVLVSPVGHLIEARMRLKLADGMSVTDAEQDATTHHSESADEPSGFRMHEDIESYLTKPLLPLRPSRDCEREVSRLDTEEQRGRR